MVDFQNSPPGLVGSNQNTGEFNGSFPASPLQQSPIISPSKNSKKSKPEMKLSIVIDEEIELTGGGNGNISPKLNTEKNQHIDPTRSAEIKSGFANQLNMSSVSKVSINDVASHYSKYLDKKHNALQTSTNTINRIMDDPINGKVGRTKYKTPVPNKDLRKLHRQTSHFGGGELREFDIDNCMEF